ncbi:hypothetical protein ACHAPJ_005248 [Fusarium lateritium]
MPGVEILKGQALTTLANTVCNLGRAMEACGTVDDVSKLPPAFTAMVKSLPPIEKVLSSLQTTLDNPCTEEQAIKKYVTIKQVASECDDETQYIEVLCGIAFSSTDWKEGYRKVVKLSGGKRVEQAMSNLLQSASRAAEEAFLSKEQVNVLHKLLDEVNQLPPSLEEETRTGVTLNNSGPGNQFYHGGTGHQHPCFGGFQVAGENHHANYSYAAKAHEHV